jgi:LysR family transcriptional regulator, cyn operon transcriptional activator
MMNLKHVKTFAVIAKHGSVAKATDELRITQPALSRQIKTLQEELGLRLFDLVGRRLSLTAEGKEFLQQCHGLLGHAGAVLESARSLGRGKTGVLRVGAAPQTIARFFPSFLQSYEKDAPDIRVRLVEAKAADQLAMVERGDLHFAITIILGEERRFASQPLPSVPLLALSTERYRVDRRGIVDVRNLDGVPLLLLGSGFATRATFDAACRLARISPNVIFESTAPHTLADLAEAHQGVAIVPGTFASASARLRAYPLIALNSPVQLDLAVLWDSKRPVPRMAERFPKAFATHVEKLVGSRSKSRARS